MFVSVRKRYHLPRHQKIHGGMVLSQAYLNHPRAVFIWLSTCLQQNRSYLFMQFSKALQGLGSLALVSGEHSGHAADTCLVDRSVYGTVTRLLG